MSIIRSISMENDNELKPNVVNDNNNDGVEKVDNKVEEKLETATEQKVEGKIDTNKKATIVTEIEITKNPSSDYANLVEDKRSALFDNYKKSRRNNNIILIVVVLFVVGAIGLLAIKQQWSTYLGYGLAGATLIGLIIYYVITKKKFPDTTKIYIEEVTKILDANTFSGEGFSDLKVLPKEKLKIAEVSCDKVYANSTNIGSRNYVNGLFEGKHFTCADLALYHMSNEKKAQQKVSFLGKYITITNSLKFDGRIIVVKQGEQEPDKLIDQPTDIQDLKELAREDKFVIYGSEGLDYKKVLPSKFIKQIKELDVKGLFLNFVVCVWAGHTAFYLSYDDPVIAIPFEKPYTNEGQELYRSNVETVFQLSKLINK